MTGGEVLSPEDRSQPVSGSRVVRRSAISLLIKLVWLLESRCWSLFILGLGLQVQGLGVDLENVESWSRPWKSQLSLFNRPMKLKLRSFCNAVNVEVIYINYFIRHTILYKYGDTEVFRLRPIKLSVKVRFQSRYSTNQSVK